MANSSKYRCFEKINSGGMAELFIGLATNDTGFRRLCAIKKILPQHAHKQVYINLMQQEAKLCQSLHHANIVQVWGFEPLEDGNALVMEFVNGVDLGYLLVKCRKMKLSLSVPMSCFIAAEIARGLAYVHSRKDDLTTQKLGIVHYDVSPSNILLSYDGDIKITDFGISIAKGSEENQKLFGGKISYMSPEQLSRRETDSRTDIYSLGIILWEMLAGESLFSPDSKDRTFAIEPHILRLKKKVPNIDLELLDIVCKCLQVDPEDRFQTASELEGTVQKFVQTNYPGFTRQRLAKFFQMSFVKEYESMQTIVRHILASADEPEAPVDNNEKTIPLPKQRSYKIDTSEENVSIQTDENSGQQVVVIVKTDSSHSNEVMNEKVQYHKGRDITFIEEEPGIEHKKMRIDGVVPHSHSKKFMPTGQVVRSQKASIRRSHKLLWIAVLVVGLIATAIYIKKPKFAARLLKSFSTQMDGKR